jgi:hypothetical protein
MIEFLVADNFRQADNTASIDWGWKRTRNDAWLRPADETGPEAEVKFLPFPYDDLCGRRECIVHVGWFAEQKRESAARSAVLDRGAAIGRAWDVWDATKLYGGDQ